MQLGVRDNATDQVEIRSGVSAGDTLLANAAQGLAPGTRVRITAAGDQAGGHSLTADSAGRSTTCSSPILQSSGRSSPSLQWWRSSRSAARLCINLHTDEFPDIQAPVVGLTIAYPGASPAEVEREIVKPVEDAVWGISGLDGDKSTCFAIDGLAQCTLFFDFEKPIQQASQDVRDAISTKREDLPPEMKEPILTRFDPSEAPVFTLVLTSPTTQAPVLTRIADPGIASELRSIAGVAQVNVVGEVKRNMVVELRPADLQSSGVSVAQVVAALGQQNLAAPVGWLNGNLEEKLIRLSGRLQNAADFGNLVVADRGGQIIRLSQVANVYDGTEEPRSMALFNGKQAVGIEILKSKGYSTTQVATSHPGEA